jgi:hypothetical protein
MRIATLMLALLLLGTVVQADEKVASRSTIAVWDTVQPSTESYSNASLKDKAGWKSFSNSEQRASFQGDAALSNGRILVVARKQGESVEVYSLGSGRAILRMKLLLVGQEGAETERLEGLSLVENSKQAACLETFYKTAKGNVGAKFRLKREDVSIQVEPGASAGQLRVECPSRFVVLPDFFADDIMIDARSIRTDKADLPSENFVLHLTGTGDAIGFCVFENRQQDVRIALSGSGENRQVAASEIPFEGKKIWAGVLEAPQIWHTLDIKAQDTGEILGLDWKMPFPAQWRVDFTQTDGLSDSWEMLLPAEQGEGYVKPTWLGAGDDHLGANRKRWNTVLGWYPYPCWWDQDGRGHLQPIQSDALRFQGPMIAYPINRVKQTPLDAYTVVDLMRNTLGVGPCQYILDLEGQKGEYKGRATCSVRDELTAIYQKKRQKVEKTQIDQFLDQGLTFVRHIRGRITRYMEFSHKMREYLAAQKKAHPELSELIDELDKIAGQIDARVAARKDKIHTPAYVAAMNENFRKEVRDDDGPDALAKCQKYTEALVEIGGNQDELAGECRWVVKTLRQKAGLLLAQNPSAAGIAAEIRTRTQEALRNPANHEGAHH